MSSQALALVHSPNVRMLRAIENDPRLKSAESRRGYRHDLSAFEAWRAGRPMTKSLVSEYAAMLQHASKAPASINRALAAVRWWARRLVDIAYDDAHLSKAERETIVTLSARVAEVGDVTGSRQAKGRHVESGELDALMRACAADDSPAGVRDAALIALDWVTGARRSELAGLQLADFRPTGEDEGDIIIRHGKGDKSRPVYVFNGAARALADWLALRGSESGPLFYAINKGGAIARGHGMSDEALAKMLAKRCTEAGIEHLTWHDFRRTFAGNLLDSGADLATVQRLMGHSSPTTTSNYDRRGEETKRRAVRALNVPYRRRGA